MKHVTIVKHRDEVQWLLWTGIKCLLLHLQYRQLEQILTEFLSEQHYSILTTASTVYMGSWPGVPGHHQANSWHCLSGTFQGLSANTRAVHRQPAATVNTQHHLYNKVTDLPAIIYQWTMAACTTGVLAVKGAAGQRSLPVFLLLSCLDQTCWYVLLSRVAV